ncbi:PHO85 cyclin-1, partial [Coemansia sp. RSA 2703]
MLSAIAPVPSAPLMLSNPVSSIQSQQRLMQMAVYTLKSLLRTTDAPRQDLNSGIGSLRGNFSHIMPANTASTPVILASSSKQMLPTIEVFVNNVTSTLNIKTTVFVTALVYIGRLGKRLPRSATGAPDTPYRVFLAALLLADKFWSDHAVRAKNL